MTQGVGQTYNTTTSTTTTTVVYRGGDNPDADQAPVTKSDRPSLTDTITAVTIAVLACVLIITFTLIIRAVHRRRRRERGRELNVIPTISAGIVSASVSAYGGHDTPRPVNGTISWEPVAPSTSYADIASTSLSPPGSPSNC